MLEAQKTLIYNAIQSNDKIAILFEELFEGSFRELFVAIKDLYYADGSVTKHTLEHSLTANNAKLIAILHSIVSSKITMSFEEANIIAIKDYNKRIFKELIRKDIHSDAELYTLVYDALSKFRRVDNFDLCSYVDKAIANLSKEQSSKYPIGIASIDEVIDITPDRFITIGGASGSGKTAFVVFLINNLCKLYSKDIDILFISLEMSEERIINRILSLYLKKDIKTIRKELHQQDNHTINKVLDFRSVVKDFPLEIMYCDMNINKIDNILQTHINKAKNKNKTPILFLDHFGEVVGLDENSSKQNTDKITMAMKNYAKRGGIAIGLTQLRKDLKDKKNRENYYRPSNNYIMNSQSVEARSDMILHLWRPEQDGFKDIVYEEDNDTIVNIDCRNSICLINDKNRDNNKKDIWLDCNISYNYFADIDKNKIKIITKY